MKGPKPSHPFTRLYRKVVIDDFTGCHLYTGYQLAAGYGTIGVGSMSDGTRRHALAHRISYETARGPIPPGLVIDHICRVPACVNPEHLEAVSNRENAKRGIKGALTTHCPSGHPYDEMNTILYRGKRNCRACHRERERLRGLLDSVKGRKREREALRRDVINARRRMLYQAAKHARAKMLPEVM